MMRLSIITVNYNNIDGLRKTVTSVMRQTWHDFEWIIIDGGSTDGSKELIESLNENPNANVSYWCSEPDKGVYDAMNKGILQAKGEYLNFMNSGDCYYESDSLEKVFGNTSYYQDIIAANAVKDHCDLYLELPTQETMHKRLLLYTICSHQAAFIKRELMQKYMYDANLKIVSDWKFFLYTINKCGASVHFLDTIVADVDSNGISATMISRRKEENIIVITEYYGKEVAELIQDYNSLRCNEIITKTNFLLQNDVFLYRMVRRFLSVAMKIYSIKKKIVRN